MSRSTQESGLSREKDEEMNKFKKLTAIFTLKNSILE
jgi:hypothetical protein